MLPREDAVRLRHMLDAAKAAEEFARGHSRQDLDNDLMLVFAVVRAVEVIGEAASKVTKEGRANVPDIPWAAIVGMRHRVVHAYYDIDLDRVWDTLTADLPPLIVALERALAGSGMDQA